MNYKNFNNYQLSFINYQLLIIIFLSLLLNSCGDNPPVDYQSQNFVEAYLIVDKPITGVNLMLTQSVTDSFNYANSFIRNADVFIKYNGITLKLVIDPTGDKGYYYPDTSLLVLPETIYNLEIRLKSGIVITATDTTPARFKWIAEPPDTLDYPLDSIHFSNGTDTIVRWSASNHNYPYILRTKCLDTMQYGKYINGDTTEKNRRCYRPHPNMASPNYTELTAWGIIPNYETGILWTGFKWYGLYDITVQSPDLAYLQWMVQYMRQSQYNPLLGNIKNGIGTFSSASQISKTVFIKKNIP